MTQRGVLLSLLLLAPCSATGQNTSRCRAIRSARFLSNRHPRRRGEHGAWPAAILLGSGTRRTA